MKDWSVCKRKGQWRVYNKAVWHDTFPSLHEAHTYATQSAIADVLYAPGGLLLFELMKKGADRG